MTRARFAAGIFVSAMLLFTMQPMAARMMVPLLGGAPAVWIVCSLCFQALLLAGYAYTHLVGSRTTVRTQIVLQIALVASVFLVLPVAVDDGLVRGLLVRHPTTGLILLLLRTVGLPFLVLSTTSPLLQRWFAEQGETDPYHLYAASNAGSMIALLGYPFVVEPLLGATAQSRAFHVGYGIYAALIVLCAATTVRRRSARKIEGTPPPPAVALVEGDAPPSAVAAPTSRLRQRLTWVGLAFVPSSLLLGSTEFVTTDIASIPLFWVIPLALYLASFIVAFAKEQLVPVATSSRVLAILAPILLFTVIAGYERPMWAVAALHMLVLFVAAVVCHQTLALRRPSVLRLTEFYLLMSVGGVLGGVFNGLVAPFVFDDLREYPVALALACAALQLIPAGARVDAPPSPSWKDIAFALPLALGTYVLAKLLPDTGALAPLAFAAPLLVAFSASARPVRYGLALALVCFAASAYGGESGKTLWRNRSFYGVLKVTESPSGRHRMLVYGRTMHGLQAIEPAERGVPLAYYHPTGPAGDVLGPLPGEVKEGEAHSPRRVGVIGLGIGALSAYARPGDTWTFFDINPDVVWVAREHFTFLRDAERRARISVEVGDARLRLRDGVEARFDALVLDAFSSDAIPIHLVTREALAVYRRALAPGGLLLAHVSNRHVSLAPVFAALAEEAGMGILVREDTKLTRAQLGEGKAGSTWLALTTSTAVRASLLGGGRGWRDVSKPPGQAVWTDDYANVLGAMSL